MGVQPNMQKALDAGDTKLNSDMASALRRMEAELFERERVQEELCNQINDLEMRLSENSAQLAAARAQLEKECDGGSKAREEVALLNGKLALQKAAAQIVNQELESLSYSISHDLRAPLRHLVGFSTALVEDYGESLEPTAQTYLDCIIRSGRKMETLIEALLKLSRIARQELTPARIDLSHIARQCAASLKESDPERRVVFKIADQLSVHADPVLLRAALENLLGNAWKYTGKKESATIEFGRNDEGACTVYYVRDDGAGFDLRFADRLFGPFQRMHKDGEFEGVGIGLATVQRIIHRHGGKIWAEAEVDGGATFFFTLSG